MSVKTISQEEAMNASKEYFNGDELAANVFIQKYALRNENGDLIESNPDQTHRRLAKEFARIEQKYPNPMSEDEIYKLFKDFKYIIPQGSPMATIGDKHRVQSSSNCFVIESPHDSYSGILKTDQEQAQIMKRRGGVGFDISNIRPKGLNTKNAARTTDGIGIFMERFSNTTREVAQGGRRGALMLTISIHHPEVETFIKIKKDKTKVTGANISIRISDDFMNAVKSNTNYIQQWPVDSNNPMVKKEVNAKEMWDKIIESAWDSAEPGVLFWDTMIKNSPADCYSSLGFKSVSTNPCSELILCEGDSCRLMVINTISFVKNKFDKNATFDYNEFLTIVKKAQRLMDDMVDIEIEFLDKIIDKINSDPEPEDVKKIELDLWKGIREKCVKGRRTGLGVTGIGDTIAMLNVQYGNKQSIEIVEKIYKTLAIGSYESSCEMAKERGTFPIFNHDLEHNHPFLQRIWTTSPKTYELYKKYGRRNIANTTTAPVGSISMLTQTTSGIEPTFMLSYKRRKKINPTDLNAKVDFTDNMGDKWQEYVVYHHGFKEWMEITGKTDISESPYYKSTSNDIDWLSSVEIQSVAQKWICHAISKTCNLPNSATKELVSNIYMKAWESGCKGFTVYRDGCRTGVLVENKEENKVDNRTSTVMQKTDAPKRPQSLMCDIHHVKINKKLDKVRQLEYCVIVGLFESGEPYEIFVFENGNLNKKYITGKIVKKSKGHYNIEFEDGYEIKNIMSNQTEEEELITRMVSTALRHGTPIHFIVHQLEKVKTDNIASFTKVICRVLKKYIKDGVKVTGEECPNCKSKDLIRIEGCVSCKSCGYSKC